MLVNIILVLIIKNKRYAITTHTLLVVKKVYETMLPRLLPKYYIKITYELLTVTTKNTSSTLAKLFIHLRIYLRQNCEWH